MNDSPSSPVAAMREHFGDGKPPDITRKITACIACRKQKIKCHMQRDGHPPCTRCKKRGLPCTVNKSLQMILESDADWKHAIERKLRSLEAALTKVSSHLSLPEIVEIMDEGEGELLDDGPSSAQVSSHTEKQTPQNFEVVMDPDSGPAAIPGSVISPIVVLGSESKRSDHDIVTRGIVTLEQAQAFLDMYQNRLDHFLYRIMGDRRTLQQVRYSSPLLLAAVCTVGALHLATSDFDKCYREFMAIAAAQTFSRRNNDDDIRGLCIAAFWLSDISWTCIGAAVRISTEIQIHRSIFKALAGDRTHYLRTRLYYLVYVCDHHFSVPYGRPPMTREDDAIRASMAFLRTEHATEDDARLTSQLQFWQVGGEIYNTFGIDVERPLDPTMIEPLRRFGMKLDGVRADFIDRFTHNQYVGNYPKKVVGLHHHFAKLHLYSIAFRGIGRRGFKAREIALDIDELGNIAVLSAMAILRAVVSDTEIQGYLNGLPTYFDIMIAFAVVFVLKVAAKYSASVRVDTTEVRTLVTDLVSVLKDVTSTMHPRHLLASVARGAEILLERCCPPETPGPVPSNAHVTMSQPIFDESLYNLPEWNGASFNDFSMGEYDFLSDQTAFDSFLPDFPYQQTADMQAPLT